MDIQLDRSSFNTVAKMKVIGVGGAGGNAVNRMIQEGLTGVEFIAVNTDAMALDNNTAACRLQIGEKITRGLGAGANPEIGRLAMEEDREKIKELLVGTDMVFITAGMGGGTGTGGAPVVAQVAQELDILTVAIVTRPFLFEGMVRDRNARKGIEELRKYVDTIIVIQNQKLLSIVDKGTSLVDAFKTADSVLHHATRGISELISTHGVVNTDFADVKTTMKNMGDALMGTGFATGENRAGIAADAALHCPMLDDVNISGARGILVNISGGEDLTLQDVNDVMTRIYESVGMDIEANIIFGAVNNAELNGQIKVTVIATGFGSDKKEDSRPHFSSKPKAAAPAPQTISPEPQSNLAPISPMVETQTPAVSATGSQQYYQYQQTSSQTTTPTYDEPVRNTDDYATPGRRYTSPVNQRSYAAGSEVLTQFDDDVSVPTFLRRQMQ